MAKAFYKWRQVWWIELDTITTTPAEGMAEYGASVLHFLDLFGSAYVL
jgi:hypothetical protein